MRKIAYVELDTHAEIAHNFYKLFKDSKLFEVDFFLSEKVYKIFDVKSENVKISESSIIHNQLAKASYDLVIVGTAHRYFNTFLAIASKFPMAIICHNLNFSKANKTQLLQSVFKKDWKFRIKLLLKESLLSAPYLYKKNKLLVLDEHFKNEKFEFLNLFYNQFKTEKNNTDQLCIVVPGAASQKRRDYQHIFSSLKNLNEHSAAINLVLLGKANKTIKNEIEVLKHNIPSHINIVYFQEKVSQSDFDFWMQKTDVLWCPIQKETEFLGIQEFYGISKMTGNIGDAIKYGKFAVFPKSYVSNLEFIVNEEDNVWIQFQKLKQQDSEAFSVFSKEHILEKAEQTLLNLIP